MTRPSQHIILCGLDELGIRILEALRLMGETVVVTCPASNELIGNARALGVEFVFGNYRTDAILEQAGIRGASAIIIAGDDDVGNFHAALSAQELNPALRIVLRMFNLAFGQRIQSLFSDCQVLSASAIAAPAFVSAIVSGDRERVIHTPERRLVVRRDGFEKDAILLADDHSDGTVTVFPDWADHPVWLVADGPGEPVNQPGTGSNLGGNRFGAFSNWILVADVRLRSTITVLLLLAVISTTIFAVFDNLDPLDAIYFTVTVITTTGFGDISLREAPPALKLYGILLMLIGATTLAILYALITDAIVGARLARTFGPPFRHFQNHVIVCGLGNVGFRIVEQLAARGIRTLAIESNPSNGFIAATHRLGVPTILGDVRQAETLQSARVAVARSVVAVTHDDLANLETALSARQIRPDMPIVLRLFDQDLAARVERAFAVELSRSTSALAAPVFAAAAIGRRVIATIPVGPRTLIVAEVSIADRSALAGGTVAELEAAGEARVIWIENGDDLYWRPERNVPLVTGQDLLIVATRRGLARVWEAAETPA